VRAELDKRCLERRITAINRIRLQHGCLDFEVRTEQGPTTFTMRWTQSQVQDFGGRGIEVISGSHSAEMTHEYANVARKFGFLASRASDFHGPGESYADLGKLPPLPEDLTPVWSEFF